jgi:hypothetical protein
MTKIAITPNPNGSGTFTIAAPNSNTDRTLTLPDAAGEVLTDASDIEAQVKTATNATGTAPIYACRAWVNFNGSGTVAIRASGNVSSITDNGVGDYTVNFTTAMPDINYALTTSSVRVANPFIVGWNGSATTSVNLRVANTISNALTDIVDVMVAIFR